LIFSKHKKIKQAVCPQGLWGCSRGGFHTGVPPLVHVAPGDVTDSGTHVFDGFAFRCARYEKYDSYLTDWVIVAKMSLAIDVPLLKRAAKVEPCGCN
jgi:hypothetical protein